LFKLFLPFEWSGDIFQVEKSGHFDVDVVVKPHFMKFGELSGDICKRLDPEITMKITLSTVAWSVDSAL
jgi:hypothetical protein